MIVTTTRQYLDVPRGQTVTLFNFGDTLYVGDQTVTAGANESTVADGGSVTLTAGRYLVSAGWSRVEEDITPVVPAGSSVLAPLATGNAATDTAALQALFDQGSAAVPIIIDLAPGQSYQITELVARSGVILRCNYSKLVATAGSVQGIINNRTLQTPVDRFEVYNGEFVGQGQTVGGNTDRRGAVYIYDGSRVIVRGCIAHDFSDHGFGVRNAQDCRLEDNTLWNVCDWFLGNALEFSSGLASHTAAPAPTTRGVIRGNVVVNCRTAPVCVQTTVHQSEMTGTGPTAIGVVPTPVLDYDVIVADNPYLEAIVEDVASHGFSAIALEIARYGVPGDTSQGNKMAHVHIHHNHCYMRGTSGASSPGTWGISATDNNGSNGPQSTDWDEFSDIVIDHNTIDSVDGGIVCQASRAMIDHNIIRANKRGITVSYNNNAGHTPEQIMVDGNLIHLDGTTAVNAGIYVLHTAFTTVQGNRITFYGSPVSGQAAIAHGIYANLATNVSITGNRVRGATGNGIILLTVTGYTVDDNHVLNPSSGLINTYHGCVLSSCTGDPNVKASVSYNEFADDRGAGNMMAQGFSSTGGSPRTWFVGNRTRGWTTFPIGGTAFAWFARNDLATSTGPFSPTSITVTASPFTYGLALESSSLPTPQDIVVKGGTVSKIEKKRGSATAVDTGLTQGLVHIDNGDSVIVTYTVAPTMTAIPVAS